MLMYYLIGVFVTSIILVCLLLYKEGGVNGEQLILIYSLSVLWPFMLMIALIGITFSIAFSPALLVVLYCSYKRKTGIK